MIMDFPEKTTIKEHTISIIPRYCETDQAGVVHHTVFPIWFEMGRTELLRENGVAYKNLEQAGVFFVVADLSVKYRRPALYDEELHLKTIASNVTAARVEHTYQLVNAKTKIILAEGTSILACVDDNGRPRRIPGFMYTE